MVSLIALAAFPAALIIAALNDLYEFKIPNWVSIALVVSYFIAGFAMRAPLGGVFEGAALASGALVISFALYAGNIIGGGDAKLFAATVLWVGVSAFTEFLLYMTFSGAALCVVLMLFRKAPILPFYAQAGWLMRLHQTPREVPYGVAICIGGLLSFQQSAYFRLAFGG